MIGLERGGIDSAIAAHNQATGTSLTFTIFNQETEDQALWNIVIRTDPPPGAGISQDGVITVTVGVRPSGDDG